MSYRVVIAAPSRELAADLAETVAAAGAQTVGTVTSEASLREQLLTLDADVVLVREDLGAGSIWTLIREAVTTKPYLAIVVAARSGSAEVLALAMESGARAVVELPLQVDDVATKIMSAGGWAQTMRRVIGGEREAATGAAGLMVVLAGSKGGVGTTTVATHLALTSALNDPTRRVCLVDLDIAKGDVPLYLDAQHRRSILDLAPVAMDLGPRAIADALYQHPSGLNVLLAPAEGEYAERLTGGEVSAILAGLRQRHDVVIVDAGAVISEASAAAVELADEVYVVTMPDVPSLRGARRMVEMWERLTIRKEEAVRCIINRTDKRTDIQPETAAKIAGVEVVETRLPAMFRGLEAASNQRDPDLVQSAWTTRIEQLAVELRVSSPRPLSNRAGRATTSSRREKRSSRSARKASNTGRRRAGELDAGTDLGQATLELVGLFPIFILAILLAWQGVIMGIGAHYASNSAVEGARAAAVGGDVESAAKAAVPASFAGDLTVRTSGTRVTVTIRPPLLMPGARSLDIPLSASAGSVSEK